MCHVSDMSLGATHVSARRTDLVEEERRRLVHELHRDREPLALAAAQPLLGAAADDDVRAALEPERLISTTDRRRGRPPAARTRAVVDIYIYIYIYMYRV